MASITQQLISANAIKNCPQFLKSNVQYETILGSFAYGVSSDSSDMDIYGFCIPYKEIIFPHLAGEILGFGREKQRFEQFQQHHLNFQEKNYDLNIYNITKYFMLCMENNPNMIDSLFTPINCVLHMTDVGRMVRENRKMFLHKGSYHKMLGYAHSQLHNIDVKSKDVENIRKFEDDNGIDHSVKFKDIVKELEDRITSSEESGSPLEHLSNEKLKEYEVMFEKGMEASKRFESQKIFNMDVKYMYHLIRLSDECEQILTTGDLDLQRAREHMKACRRGEISTDDLKKWFTERERTLEKLYNESDVVPHVPDEKKIKKLLIDCLEHHYGSLSVCVEQPDFAIEAIKQAYEVLNNAMVTISSK